MLAHALKSILELIPEALPLVKQASLEDSFPTDSRDSSFASALSLQYHQHVSGKPVDYFAIEKVAKAVDLYGIQNDVSKLSDQMVKKAKARLLRAAMPPEQEYLDKQASFTGDRAGFVDYELLGKRAQALYKEASELNIEPSEDVKRYSGNAFLNKEAAVNALAARYQVTQNPDFVKIASAIGRSDVTFFKPERVADICQTVAGMDKLAGLSLKGFDFYKEALLTKAASIHSALTVRLCNQDIPYEKVDRLSKEAVSHYIGSDVAKELNGDPANTKQVLETLPLDLQRVVLNLTKNV